jgi:hypothetical protein
MLFLTGFHEVPLHGRMDLTEGEDGAAVGACLGNSQYEAIAASGSGSVSGSKVLGFVDTDTDADADGFIFIFGIASPECPASAILLLAQRREGSG